MEITVTASKKSYRPLEPILLTIELRNTSEKEFVKVPMERSVYPAIPIDATDEQGVAVEKTRYVKNHRVNNTNFEGIEPKGTRPMKLLANLVNDMTDRGEYTIIAHAAFYSKSNGGRRWVGSKPITIRVEGEPMGSDEEEEK
jgi:hypothetical protein